MSKYVQSKNTINLKGLAFRICFTPFVASPRHRIYYLHRQKNNYD